MSENQNPKRSRAAEAVLGIMSPAEMEDLRRQQRPPRIEIEPPPIGMQRTKAPTATAERALPKNLDYDWNQITKLLREANPEKREAFREMLDAIDWVLTEADALDDARLFVARALIDAGSTAAADSSASTAREAKALRIVEEGFSLIMTLHQRFISAIALLDAGKVSEARALLEAQVLALDGLDTRPLEQR